MTSRYQRPLIWAGEQIDILTRKVALLEARIEALEVKPKRGRPRGSKNKTVRRIKHEEITLKSKSRSIREALINEKYNPDKDINAVDKLTIRVPSEYKEKQVSKPVSDVSRANESLPMGDIGGKSIG